LHLSSGPDRNGRQSDGEQATPLEAPGLPPGIERHKLFRLLAERSKITVNRANLVRGESAELSAVTLAGGLYIERDIEEEILRVMQSPGAQSRRS
jgi:hypothetical protein